MTNTHCRKAYVSVNLDVDEEGVCHPRFIRWENGLIFQIDQILYKCRAASKKVGGGGIRYTVMIRGRESYLFQEGTKWFVEAKEGACEFQSNGAPVPEERCAHSNANGVAVPFQTA